MPALSILEDEIESSEIYAEVNPKNGLAYIGRNIGKKYGGQKLRIIVLKGSNSPSPTLKLLTKSTTPF